MSIIDEINNKLKEPPFFYYWINYDGTASDLEFDSPDEEAAGIRHLELEGPNQEFFELYAPNIEVLEEDKEEYDYSDPLPAETYKTYVFNTKDMGFFRVDLGISSNDVIYDFEGKLGKKIGDLLNNYLNEDATKVEEFINTFFISREELYKKLPSNIDFKAYTSKTIPSKINSDLDLLKRLKSHLI